MQRKKVTGDDNIPVHLRKEMGYNGLKIMTLLVNKIYMSGDWSKDFPDVKMIALRKENQAKKCRDHRKISLISQGIFLHVYLVKNWKVK